MATIIKTGKKASYNDRALAWIAQANCKDANREILNGILFVESTNNTVHAIATDARRLHMARLPLSYVESLNVRINKDSDSREEWQATQIAKFTKTELILGDTSPYQYPNYKRVIPSYTHIAPIPTVENRFMYGAIASTLQKAGTLVKIVDANFVTDLTNYDYYPTDIAYYPCTADSPNSDKNKAILISSENDSFERIAVIMPIAD